MRTAEAFRLALLPLGLCANGVQAQALEREVIAATGTERNLGAYSFEESVGEVVVVSGSTGNYLFTQGFNQAYNDLPETIADADTAPFTVQPNPTRGEVTLNWPTSSGPLVVEVYDPLGALLRRERTAGAKGCQLDMAPFAAGTYLVRVINASGASAAARVEKTR